MMRIKVLTMTQIKILIKWDILFDFYYLRILVVINIFLNYILKPNVLEDNEEEDEKENDIIEEDKLNEDLTPNQMENKIYYVDKIKKLKMKIKLI